MKANYTFLLIEDNAIDQLVTKQLLCKTLGIDNINIVDNGKEALQWITNNVENLDNSLVILLDINMPVMNGFQFLKEYEALPEGVKKQTLIFMLSSTLSNEDLDKIKKSSCVKTLLNKPLSIQKLLQFI
ncbi:response regulator [Flavobacterium sp. GCM10023249]|uniref:response regulator n=1 Tax=unclassified Flavobacterium TaxID=196869 RepID=UPI00361EA1BE